MILLVLGILLWIGAHSFRRVAPDQRARMGEKGRGPIALAIFVSVVLMVVGYRISGGPSWWEPSAATVGINNLLVLIAFYLFAASGMKTRVARAVRHPQLIALSLWAVAHLLVNGDLASLILFGGLLAWALWEIAGATNPVPAADTAPPAKKDAMALVGGAVVFAAVALIHWWIGPYPFGA